MRKRTPSSRLAEKDRAQRTLVESLRASLANAHTELAAIQKAMQPHMDLTAPTPPLVMAVEAMALGSRMIFEAQTKKKLAARAEEVREACARIPVELRKTHGVGLDMSFVAEQIRAMPLDDTRTEFARVRDVLKCEAQLTVLRKAAQKAIDHACDEKSELTAPPRNRLQNIVGVLSDALLDTEPKP